MYTYPEALNAMEKIAHDLFRRAYPNVIWNVRVAADAVSGTASVDWTGDPKAETYVRVTINMPIRPATYRMSASEFEQWAAYLLHEVGHPNETDMVVWKAAVADGKHRLLNALEDVREEKRTIDRGLAHNALEVFSKLIDMLHAKAKAQGFDPNEPANIGWTLSALGRHANGYAIDVSDIHATLDPNGIVGSIVAWALKDLAACTSTRDCMDLSERVIEAVRASLAEQAAKKPEPEPEPETKIDLPDFPGEGFDMGEDDDLSPEGQSAGGDIPEEEDSEPRQGGGGNMAGADAEEPEDRPGPEEEFSDRDIAEVDMRPSHRDDMHSSGATTTTQRKLNNIVRNVLKNSRKDYAIHGRDMGGSVGMVTGNAAGMGRQRALLARAMKANENDSYDGNRAHGRINTRALGRFAAGNMNVFGKRVVTEGYDTDVQILVDGSGSMSGSRIIAASSLALVVSQAASQVGVDCAAHVFNDNGLHFATKGKAKPKPNKFAYMLNQIMGGTPLTENLLAAARMQDERAKGKRKILFVITDGGCNMGPDVVKAAGHYIENTMGTEIANLHIGDQPMGLFRNEVAVNVRKVSDTGLRQLTALLERGL